MRWQLRSGGSFLTEADGTTPKVFPSEEVAREAARAYNKRHGKGTCYALEVNNDGSMTEEAIKAELVALEYLQHTLFPGSIKCQYYKPHF